MTSFNISFERHQIPLALQSRNLVLLRVLLPLVTTRVQQHLLTQTAVYDFPQGYTLVAQTFGLTSADLVPVLDDEIKVIEERLNYHSQGASMYMFRSLIKYYPIAIVLFGSPELLDVILQLLPPNFEFAWKQFLSRARTFGLTIPGVKDNTIRLISHNELPIGYLNDPTLSQMLTDLDVYQAILNRTEIDSNKLNRELVNLLRFNLSEIQTEQDLTDEKRSGYYDQVMRRMYLVATNPKANLKTQNLYKLISAIAQGNITEIQGHPDYLTPTVRDGLRLLATIYGHTDILPYLDAMWSE